ncbi:MAG: DsbA family protein [Alphaproteobacteria bacterium]|nr:DsbA family protein [Alphaproteobacteria bacterium]
MQTFGLFILGFLILVGYKFYYGFVIDWKKERKASMPKRLFTETILPAIFLFVGTYFVASLAVRPTMMQHPEILEDTFKSLEAKKTRDTKEQTIAYLEKNREALEKDAPILGNSEGDVTIYEFFDYSCGHCRAVSKTVDQLLAKDKNVKVVLKQFPISQFTFTAAQASIASKLQGQEKSAALHKIMMDEGVIPEGLSKDMPKEAIEKAFKDHVLALAKKAGLDTEKLAKDMESDQIMAELHKTREAGQEFGVEGTPFFIVGEEVFPGALPLAAFEKAIAEARK